MCIVMYLQKGYTSSLYPFTDAIDRKVIVRPQVTKEKNQDGFCWEADLSAAAGGGEQMVCEKIVEHVQRWGLADGEPSRVASGRTPAFSHIQKLRERGCLCQQVGLIVQRFDWEPEWLFVSICQPCDELVSWTGCNPPSSDEAGIDSKSCLTHRCCLDQMQAKTSGENKYREE